MCCIHLRKLSDVLSTLTIDEREIIIKPCELRYYQDTIRKLLPDTAPCIDFDCKELTLDIPNTSYTQFTQQFETVSGKNVLTLPKELEQSHGGKHLLIYYQSVDAYQTYWLKDEESRQRLEAKLYQQLSDDILQQPYVDEPLDYLFRHAKFAFHPNHGSAHGLRSSMLMEILFQKIKLEKLLPDELKTAEVLSCLKLAAFLFRSGRTSEVGWRADLSYSKRSAFIFKTIATQLKFNHELTEAIATMFDFSFDVDRPDNTLFTTMPLSTGQKLCRTLQRLLEAVHTCELIRCFTNKHYLEQQLSKQLAAFEINELERNIMVCDLLQLAEKLCLKTGAGVAYKLEICDLENGKDNPYKLTEASNDIISSYEILRKVCEDVRLVTQENDSPPAIIATTAHNRLFKPIIAMTKGLPSGPSLNAKSK